MPGPDGPPQAIRSDEDEEVEAARDDVRLFGIFLDDYHTRRGASVSVREPIAKFVSTQLGPSDMVGLMYPLQPVSSVRMTRDHDRVIQGLGSFVGRKGDYTPRNAMEEQYSEYPAETVELIRNQVSLSALKGLITHMGSLKQGRKALILVSEGYSNTLPPQLRDPNAALPGLDNPNRDNPQAGVNDPNEQSRQFFDDATMSLTLREVWDLANKNNVAIYAVDPRGLPVSEFDVSQPTVALQIDRQYLNATMDTLRTLALQTDGRAIVNRNDLAQRMSQIVRDTSSDYLLGYNSTQAPADGKFHEIKVQVKRPGHSGAGAAQRPLGADDPGRCARPGSEIEPPKGVETALATIECARRSHNAIRTWIGTSWYKRQDPGRTSSGNRRRKWRAIATREAKLARVMVTAVVGRVAGPSRTCAGRCAASLPPGPSIDSIPCDVRSESGQAPARLSVEGSSSQVLDTETREIAVPDLHRVGRSSWKRRRCCATDRARLPADHELPTLATASGARSFRGTMAPIRVTGGRSGNTVPALAADLLNRGGQTMSAAAGWDDRLRRHSTD